MTNIVETYTHDLEHPAFKNFQKASPARWGTNDALEDEHMHLSILHPSPRNPNHTEALQDHTASSQALNMALVDNRPGEYTNNKARTISHAIKDNMRPLETDHHVYSGLGDFNPHSILEHSNGVFKAKHFISATIDPDIAMRHDNHKRMMGSGGTQQTDSHILHFHLPAGYDRGRYIAPLSEFQGEHEFLLDRHQHWKVDNVHTIHGAHHVTGAPLSRTIWSVKPHTPEAVVKEAMVHVPQLFKQRQVGVDHRPGDSDKYYEHSESDRKLREETGNVHHDHLIKTHAFTPTDEDQETVNRYTRGSSSEINGHLLRSPHDRADHEAQVVASYNMWSKQEHEPAAETIHDIPDYHNTIKHHDTYAAKLSGVIDKHSVALDHEAHVYSGVGFDPSEHFKRSDGVVHMPAFTSTSLNIQTPMGFGKIFNAENHRDAKDIKPFDLNLAGNNPLKKEDVASAKHITDIAKHDKHIIHFKLPVGYKKGLYIQPHSNYKEEHEYLLDKNQKWKLEKHEVVNSWKTYRFRTRNGWDSPHIEKSTSITRTKRHIWTVVPHDEKPVTEALVHVPSLLKERTIHVADSWHTAKIHKKVVDHIRSKIDDLSYTAAAIADTHHEHLVKHNPYDLHPHDLKLVDRYTCAYSRNLNSHLITPNSGHPFHDELTADAHQLSGIIQKHAKPLDHEAHFYSGVGFDPSKHFEESNGVIHMPAFISSSASTYVAKDFGNPYAMGHNQWETKSKAISPKPAFDFTAATARETVNKLEQRTKTVDHHIFHFKCPPGFNKGLYVAPHSRLPEEHEFLMDKGQKWKLEKHEVIPGHKTERFEGQEIDFSHEGLINGAFNKTSNKTKVNRHIWTVVPHTDTP